MDRALGTMVGLRSIIISISGQELRHVVVLGPSDANSICRFIQNIWLYIWLFTQVHHGAVDLSQRSELRTQETRRKQRLQFEAHSKPNQI